MSPMCFDAQIYAPYLKSMLMITKRSQPSTRDHFRMHRQRLQMHATRFLRATKARARDSSWRAANNKDQSFSERTLSTKAAAKQYHKRCWTNPMHREEHTSRTPTSRMSSC